MPGKLFRIEHSEKRLIIFFDAPVEKESVFEALQIVFGLANFSAVSQVPSTPAHIRDCVLDLLRGRDFGYFAIRARRVHKSLPFSSMEINHEVGAAVVERYRKKVDLKHPECACHIEIFRDKAFVSVDKIKGPGGLPVGSSGRVMVLMSGGFDSPVAAFYALKRGASCEFIHFHSHPFTDRASQEKVKQLVSSLSKYQLHSKLYMVPFVETQKEIVAEVPAMYRVVFYRRFMMRIAERLAQQNNIRAIVTGESLGQVASQTIENMAAVEQVVTLPVLRPLIGLDKNEIMDFARRIGTYDISVLPHDDACTRFMPDAPVIRSSIEDVLKIEQALNVDELIERDLAAMELLEL
jgi:thiamine biosynthesis protein ThiI